MGAGVVWRHGGGWVVAGTPRLWHCQAHNLPWPMPTVAVALTLGLGHGMAPEPSCKHPSPLGALGKMLPSALARGRPREVATESTGGPPHTGEAIGVLRGYRFGPDNGKEVVTQDQGQMYG